MNSSKHYTHFSKFSTFIRQCNADKTKLRNFSWQKKCPLRNVIAEEAPSLHLLTDSNPEVHFHNTIFHVCLLVHSEQSSYVH